ncbi:hypothetical protein TSMEX_008732, partial [Taenia solium]
TTVTDFETSKENPNFHLIPLLSILFGCGGQDDLTWKWEAEAAPLFCPIPKWLRSLQKGGVVPLKPVISSDLANFLSSLSFHGVWLCVFVCT